MTEDYRAKKPKIPFFLLFNSQKRPSNANFPKLKLADLGHTSSNFPSLNQESKKEVFIEVWIRFSVKIDIGKYVLLFESLI